MTEPRYSYLDLYVQLFERTEVPPRFVIWTGIATLLAALERRIWIDEGVYTVYPNEYIILIAAAGERKSTPISKASKLLRRMDLPPNIVAQKITVQSLIQSLKTTTAVTAPGAKILAQEKCGGIAVADELTTFLEKGALEGGLGPVLTKLWDCDVFDYQTISRGREIIKDGYMSLLGGTTVKLIKKGLPEDSVSGGFASRTVFVFSDERPPPVARPKRIDSARIEAELVAHLNELSKLEGEVSLTDEAWTFFEKIYNERYYKSTFRQDENLFAYENRRHVHLLKVSMAMMVSEGPGLEITLHHIQAAHSILEECEQHLPTVINAIVSTDTGAINQAVLNYIQQRGEVDHAVALKAFTHKLNAYEFSKIIDTLVGGGRVERGTGPTRAIRYKFLK